MERAVLLAQKNHADAVMNWVGLGRQGPMPEYGPFLLEAMQGAALVGGLPAGQLDFADILTDIEGRPGEETIGGGVRGDPEPSEIVPRALSPREESKVGRSLVAQSFIGKGVVDDTLEAKLLRRKMPAFRDIKEDEIVITAARQMDEIVKHQVSDMTIEEARAAIKERRWALSEETIAALRARIAELRPPTEPSSAFSEALGAQARRR